jgi:hypothetical protein
LQTLQPYNACPTRVIPCVAKERKLEGVGDLLGFEHDSREQPIIRLWNYVSEPRE